MAGIKDFFSFPAISWDISHGVKVSFVCLFVRLSNLSFGLGTVVPRLDEQCVRDVPDLISEVDSLLNLASVGLTEFIPGLM